MAKQNKISQAEQITVTRSQVNFASYNPRKISDEARKQLKRNMQSVGLLGGIVWNRSTGNLVAGHQKVAIMDSVNRYDPSDPEGKNDYEFRVEVVDLDEKTEKEQNLFMNNRNVQGEYDEDLLRQMLAGIDYEAAGFSEFDMQMYGLADFGDYDPSASLGGDEGSGASEAESAPAWNKQKAMGDSQELAIHDELTQQGGENKKLDRSANFYNDTAENQIARHNEVQKIKDRIAGQNDINKDGGMLSYVVISFKTPTEKMTFMESYGYDPYAKYINGDEFVRKLEFGDDEEEEDGESNQ